MTDLAVGAYRDDDGGSDRGAVHIMFMNMDGTVDSTVEINDSTTNGPTLSNNDRFGASVTPIGDLDGDGVTDLAVGAAQDDDGGSNRGAVHIMFMNTNGTVNSTVEINDSTTNGPTLSNSDFFGVSVASIGDLDGDGVTDLAVGAYRDDDGGPDRGAINVIYLDKEVEQNKDIDPTAPTVTDTTPPRVASILRGTPLAQSTTDTTLVFAVTFDEPVTNVDDADFTVTGSGTGTISNVSGSGTSYRVTVTVDNVGTIGLDIAQNHDIQDTATNRLANLTPTGSDQTYTVTVTDTTPPRVASILRGTPLAQSTTDTTLVFAVTFDEPVTNVDDADFTVTGSGTGTISNVSGSGTSYRVTVTVDNVGTIGLDIAQNHDIQDTATNRLANLTPTGSDQTYIVTVTDTTPPRVAFIVDRTVEINSSTTNGPTLSDTDRFGFSVASIGDLDGDGVTDLAVGAYRDDDSGSSRGAVHIMFMNTDGTVDSTVEINDSTTNGPTLSGYDSFGISVASIGDLDGDGVTDLAVGAYRDDDGGSNRGAVHIMFMNTNGTVDSTVEINDSTTNGPTLSDYDSFGFSVASIGDLDGDGVTDLAVGAFLDEDGGSNRGAVHIMFMNTNGTVDSTVEINDSTTNGPTLSGYDSFGISVASIGDLDGDGVTDLAVGAHQDDDGGSNRGAVHIMFMNTNGTVDSTVEINDSTTNGPTLSNGDRFGRSVASIGDFDGDGVTDLAVGAYRDDDGGQDRGAVHIMFMNTNGTVNSTVEINDSTTNGPTLSNSDFFGVSVASIGDLDGDGVTDLAVGAYRDDDGGPDRGAINVIYLDKEVDESGKPLESFVDAAILLKSKKSGTAPPSVDTLEINGQSYNVQNRVNHHPTPLEVAVDQPIFMSFTAHDRLDILYFAVYLNLQDDDISYTNSDTYVEYNRGKTNIVDPHNLFSDASITISTDPDDRNKKTVTLDITFADAIGNTNMVIRTWNADQKSSIVIITDVLNVIHLQVGPEPQVTGVDPEPQVTGVDPEPQVTGVDPEPQLPAVPNPELGTETFADDFDYDRALLVLRMWSGFESEIADDNQLLAVMGLTHMGTDIPAWVMTDLAPLVVKGLITLDEFRVALEYVMGNT